MKTYKAKIKGVKIQSGNILQLAFSDNSILYLIFTHTNSWVLYSEQYGIIIPQSKFVFWLYTVLNRSEYNDLKLVRVYENIMEWREHGSLV